MNYKHGDCDTRFYCIWQSMKNRCVNKKSKYYENNIQICDDWSDYLNFKSDMYEEYLNHSKIYGEQDTTIDRIDVNGNYTKENCRWATYQQQAQNRNSNIFITYNNETHCLSDWSKLLNIKRLTLSNRIKSGWTIDEAFEINVCMGQMRREKQEKIEFEGKELTINEWSKLKNIKPCTIRNRLRRGWSVEKALTTHIDKL